MYIVWGRCRKLGLLFIMQQQIRDQRRQYFPLGACENKNKWATQIACKPPFLNIPWVLYDCFMFHLSHFFPKAKLPWTPPDSKDLICIISYAKNSSVSKRSYVLWVALSGLVHDLKWKVTYGVLRWPRLDEVSKHVFEQLCPRYNSQIHFQGCESEQRAAAL